MSNLLSNIYSAPTFYLLLGFHRTKNALWKMCQDIQNILDSSLKLWMYKVSCKMKMVRVFWFRKFPFARDFPFQSPSSQWESSRCKCRPTLAAARATTSHRLVESPCHLAGQTKPGQRRSKIFFFLLPTSIPVIPQTPPHLKHLLPPLRSLRTHSTTF